MFLGRCVVWRTERDAWLEGVLEGYVAGVTVSRQPNGAARADAVRPGRRGGLELYEQPDVLYGLWTVGGGLGRLVRAGWERPVHHVLANAVARLTLLLVALLKNAERRAEHAIQGKLDRLAEAMLAERCEHPDDGAEQLEEAVGMHDEV